MTISAVKKRNRAVFFDRDGVLNKDIGYLSKVDDFEWIDGAREALRRVQDLDMLSIVVTNQSGVGRGYYSLEDVMHLHAWMRADLARDNIVISDFYLCAFHEDATIEQYRVANHPDRKPNPGMLERAIADWNIDRDHSLMIGDKPSDIAAGEAAGVRSVLFEGGNLARSLEVALIARNINVCSK